MITIDDFAKVELKIGTVLECEDVEESEKLLKLKVDLGEDDKRQVLSGIKQWYKSEDLVGKQFVFVTNLEPRIMMGLESNGMILAANSEIPIPIAPIKEVAPGTKLR